MINNEQNKIKGLKDGVEGDQSLGNDLKVNNKDESAGDGQRRASKRIVVVMFAVVVIFAAYFLLMKSDEDDLSKREVEQKLNVKNASEKEAIKNEILNNIQSVTPVVESQNNSQELNNNMLNSGGKKEELVLKEPEPPAPPPPPAPKLPPRPVIEVAKSASKDLGNRMSDSKSSLVPSPPALKIDGRSNIVGELTGASQEEKMKKMKAGIIVFGSGATESATGVQGGETGSTQKQMNGALSGNVKGNLGEYKGFDGGMIDGDVLSQSGAENSVATKLSYLDRMVLQGKIIDAVLETAVNTDIAGYVRAMITHDVYAEKGKNILIPRGSRVVGQYTNDVQPGQTRVGIAWSRVITPYGVDIQIDSQGGDALGRMGVMGSVDTKMKEILFNAFLVSYLIPYAATKMSGENGNVTITDKKNDDGTSTQTTTGSPEAIALMQANQKFSQVATDAVNNSASLKPTISISQGTRITVMVQKDLIFPSESLKLMQKHGYNN